MTIEQLAIKVLSKLGVWQRSTLQPEDLENVTDAYKGVWYTLNDDGLVTWALMTGDEVTDIPDRFQLPMTSLIAAEIGPFYNSPETDPRLKQILTNAIRRQLAPEQPTDTVIAEYY